MPWINYSFPVNSTAETHIKNADRVKFDVSFDPNINIQVNTFDLRLVKYSWNGTYVDTIQLKDELILCSGKVNDGQDFRSFGKNIIHDCYIDLAKFLDRNEEMFFYEIYLYDSQAANFVDVPVLIDNIQNELIYTYYSNWRNFKVIPFSNSQIKDYLPSYEKTYNTYAEIIASDDSRIKTVPLAA